MASCCGVNKCCCCLDHYLGVKLLATFLIIMEVVYIILTLKLKPNFVSFVVPTCAVGILCHILLLVAVFKVSRWFCIPWLIYVMLIIVTLCLALVLQIVITFGASGKDIVWEDVIPASGASLLMAAIYIYFWIVVLELFIKMAPAFPLEGAMIYGLPPPAMYPCPSQQMMQVPMQAVPLVCNQGDGQPMMYFPTQPIACHNQQASYIQHG